MGHVWEVVCSRRAVRQCLFTWWGQRRQALRRRPGLQEERVGRLMMVLFIVELLIVLLKLLLLLLLSQGRGRDDHQSEVQVTVALKTLKVLNLLMYGWEVVVEVVLHLAGVEHLPPVVHLLLPDHPPLDLGHPRGVAAVQDGRAVVRRGRGGRRRGGVLLPPQAAEGGRRGRPLGVGGGHAGGHVQGRGGGGELALAPLLGADAVVDDPARRGELHPVAAGGDGVGGERGGRADGRRRGGRRARLAVAGGNAQRAAVCAKIDSLEQNAPDFRGTVLGSG